MRPPFTSSEAMSAMNNGPYQQASYPPVPTGLTRYLRTSILWQVVRFLVINLRILKLLTKSHG